MGGRAVAEFAGKVQPARRRGLARDFGLRGAAGLARARRENDAADDRFSDRPVVIQPVFESGPDDGVNRGRHFRVVEAILGLSLKLRLLDEQAEHSGQPLTDVLRRQRHAFRRQAMGLDVVANRLADARSQPVFVGAAGAGWNAVHIAANVLVGGLRPLQDEVESWTALALEHERCLVNRPGRAFGDDLGDVFREPFLVLENVLRALRPRFRT
jgi:hypothetical protein